MRIRIALVCLVFATVNLNSYCASMEIDVPGDFPQFALPGHESEMKTLRELFYHHYVPGRPLSTLWDEWMSGSTLWPALETENRMSTIRERWARALSDRIIDPEGYVASHQHSSIAHQLGWPFPFWRQGGEGTWGWHFSLQGVPQGWHNTKTNDQKGWTLKSGEDLGIDEVAWNIRLTSPTATLLTPPLLITPDQAPFIQLRWRADGLDNAQPYLEWTTEASPGFSPEKRFYFPPIDKSQGMQYIMVPVYRSPHWQGRITRLRIAFDNPAGAKVGVQALFTQYDTRHNINNQNFIRGCCQYFWWTRDLNFLRNNIGRIRLAMLYLMHDLGGLEEKCIVTPYVGHCGLSGIEITEDGRKISHSGRGIGNNYWDLLPMGHKDAYATIHYYDALQQLARLEAEIDAHPEWNIPIGPLRRDAKTLLAHAADVKKHAGEMFWSGRTGRIVCGIDVDGKSYDYGFTFINCEAVYYGFATDSQAESIVRWLTGERIVEGDTSQGDDIYHWRFGPRATTKRNVEYYGWFWRSPESIPWGNQVQDGGGVLGFSYHDLMTRLKTRGPDNAWHRLREIIAWFDDIKEAGGYREYYIDGSRGTLQGGGTPGGLGLDREFFESILVPQVMLNGFLGFRPRGDGFEVFPQLPADWPKMEITRIHFHNLILDISATDHSIEISSRGKVDAPLSIRVPDGRWYVGEAGANGVDRKRTVTVSSDQPAVVLIFDRDKRVEFSRPLD